MYNPAMGVWTIRDPVQEGLNLYQYVDNDPVKLVDPTGLFELGVHVKLTEAAAVDAGYDKTKDKNFFCGLLGEKGVKYPDIPEGYVKAGNVLGVKKANDGSITGRSHYGDLQYWHSMATPGLDAAANAKAMGDWIVGQYILARNAADPEAQGEAIGKGLHTLEDSYALSHTQRQVVRNADGSARDLGGITRFQDYGAQDPNKHHTADVENDNDPMNVLSRGTAKTAATELLTMLRANSDPESVRRWLAEGPLRLAPGARSGGTGPQYAKPPPPRVNPHKTPLWI
jgi:hypothetical protein